MQVSFGSGLVAFTPPGSNPTPIVCGVLSDISLKMSSSFKKLYGQNRWPVAVADGEGSLTGSAKFAQMYGSFFKNTLGGVISTGQTIGAINEVTTLAASVTVINSATFVADFSVYDFTANKPMTRVASGPATGQYSVTAGVYTFAVADAGHQAGINYSYTAVTGQTVKVTNALMGATNAYSAVLFNNYNGQNSGVKLYAVAIAGVDLALKNSDFTLSTVSFEGFADPSGNVLDTYTAE